MGTNNYKMKFVKLYNYVGMCVRVFASTYVRV